jgi:hypothetical protein
MLIFSCSKDAENEAKIDVFEIRNVGLLSTSEYTIGKVIELKDDSEWYKFGDRNKMRLNAGQLDLKTKAKENLIRCLKPLIKKNKKLIFAFV